MILTHYFPIITSNETFTHSITECSVNEQQNIAEQLSHCSGRALHRFKRFNNYILQRNETENWLYSQFLEIGGHPTTMYPFYFIVGENQQLKRDFGTNVQTLQLNTNIINCNHLSFTLGDSVGMFYSSAPNKIYLLNQLEELLSDPEFIEWQMKPLKTYHRYIEAQLWDKHYLNKIFNS